MTTSPSTHRADELFEVADLPVRGFVVLRNRVPRDAAEAALRHIILDLVGGGVDAESLGKWLCYSHCSLLLRGDEPIASLAAFLPDEVRDGEQCDPQIVVQPP